MNKDTPIGILGYAREGQDTEAYLLSHGYKNITILDNNPNATSLQGNPVIAGPDALEHAGDFGAIFRTPGIQIRLPQLQKAIHAGTVITSQTEYFLKHAKGITVGITGTKGKSTTSTLVYEFLKEAGKDVYLVGNIGKSMLSLLDSLTNDSIIVMELSSFQLQDISVSPNISIMLAITPEHLDYHTDMAEYVEAKASITTHQSQTDMFIFNADNELSAQVGHSSPAKTVGFSTETIDGIAFAGEKALEVQSEERPLYIPYEDIALRGVHQRQNILPAVIAASHLGVESQHIIAVLKRFTGLPYRMEFTGNFAGISFYNDSLATTPEASVAAVRAMTGDTVLILGGGDKGVSFDEMARELVQEKQLRHIILIGHDSADRIAESFAKTHSTRLVWGEDPLGDQLSILHIPSYSELEETLKSIGKPGMNVLLSPACSSFDFFKDYKERGDYFSDMAKRFG